MYSMSNKQDNPPHIYAIADLAFQSMMGLRGKPACSQCILIR